MMSPKFYLLLTVAAACTAAVTADLFSDILRWDLVGAFTGDTPKEGKNKPDESEEVDAGRGCECKGMGCNCCVDFNLTTIIDLGGPGCVRMLYLSKDEGVALNVSYGDSLLHSQTVRQNDKKGSCMDLLSEFAQICARFSELKSTDDGLQGCLNFEPHVLGEVTAQYPVGCFRMGPDGMVQDPTLLPDDPSEQTAENAGEQEEPSSSILDVVNQSAEQGIAFISDLFGFKITGKKDKPTTEKAVTTETPADSDEEEEEESEDAQEERRAFGSVKTNEGRQQRENLV